MHLHSSYSVFLQATAIQIILWRQLDPTQQFLMAVYFTTVLHTFGAHLSPLTPVPQCLQCMLLMEKLLLNYREWRQCPLIPMCYPRQPCRVCEVLSMCQDSPLLLGSHEFNVFPKHSPQHQDTFLCEDLCQSPMPATRPRFARATISDHCSFHVAKCARSLSHQQEWVGSLVCAEVLLDRKSGSVEGVLLTINIRSIQVPQLWQGFCC